MVYNLICNSNITARLPELEKVKKLFNEEVLEAVEKVAK
jgi:hypothetical protein